MRLKRVRSVAVATAVAAGLVLVVSACGGGGGSNTNTTTTTQTTASGQRTFPELKAVWGTTDYMDPGLSYRLESWQVFQDTYIGLVVKARVSCLSSNCTKILPGLATTTGDDHERRQDLQVHVAEGDEVLERRAHQGE